MKERKRERDWMILLRTRRFFPEWGWQSSSLKARHEVERLRNNRTTLTPPRFFSRITLLPRNGTRCTKLKNLGKEVVISQGFEASEFSQRGCRACLVSAPETCSIFHVLHRRVIFIFLLSLARHVGIRSSRLKSLFSRDFYQSTANLMKRDESS